MSLDLVLLDDACPACHRGERVFSTNYTSNVAPMWRLVGVYEALYESHDKTAGETLPALRAGVEAMTARIVECRALNPANGWGDADRALWWLRSWLGYCERYPMARIRVSR